MKTILNEEIKQLTQALVGYGLLKHLKMYIIVFQDEKVIFLRFYDTWLIITQQYCYLARYVINMLQNTKVGNIEQEKC